MEEQCLSFIPLTGSIRSVKSRRISEDNIEQIDLWNYELFFRSRGYTFVVGIDEAGRGPIAGPVVAACAHLPDDFDICGIDDSKRLTKAQRESAYVRITGGAIIYTVGVVDSADIDQINILRATHLAMRRAVNSLPFTPEVILVDGLQVPSMAECEHLAIIGGDSLSASIAAASIVAKVTRDRLMVEFAELYPDYGFERHKGYCSHLHLEALHKHGPCPIHRRSFAPVAATFEANLFE